MAAPVTLILGLGRDVGVSCARRFHETGHKLVVAGPSEAALDRAKRELPETITFHNGELHSQIGLRNVLTAAREAWGRHDNLVVIPPLPDDVALAELDMAAYDRAMLLSARAATLVLSLFRDALSEQTELERDGLARRYQAGTVTFVLSLGALLHNPGHFLEAVTQSAILSTVRAGALELADAHIRVNAISAIRPRAEDNEVWLKTRTPLGRPSLADEIADAAVYLASPQSAIVTGEVLTLDGGRSRLGGTLDTDRI